MPKLINRYGVVDKAGTDGWIEYTGDASAIPVGAKVLLESVPSIAVACGYSDPAAFRRIFVRYTGVAPGEYRKRHALRAPRKRWRVDLT